MCRPLLRLLEFLLRCAPALFSLSPAEPVRMASAYGRLLLANHEQMMTCGLVACDWLGPVTRGSSNQRWYTPCFKLGCNGGCNGGWGSMWIIGSVVVLLLTWAHILLFLLWCTLSHPLKNQISDINIPPSPPPKCGLNFAGGGGVTLDTTIVPDVFWLHAFDTRPPVVQVPPGNFSTMVCVLVPDSKADPVGFHDYQTRRIIMSSRCHWLPSLFAEINKHQVDMESLRRDYKRNFDNEFGGGCAGDCPHCGANVNVSLARHIMNFHLPLGQL